MSAPVLALGTVLVGAAAPAAAALSAGTAALGVIGSAVAGAATAWSDAREAKKRREFLKEQDEEDDQRRKDRYAGVADAAGFWNDPTAGNLGNPGDPALGLVGSVQRGGQVGRPNERIGRRSDQMGSQAAKKIRQQSDAGPRKPKYSYSPETSMIEISG